MRLRPGFTEAWFPPESQSVLARLVADVEHVPGLIVEVGAWEGRSTIALANAAWPRRIQAVDTWAGSPGEISSELAAGRDVFAQWKLNIEHFTQGNVTPWKMGWRKYLSFIDVPVALAFIDAEHTFIEVKENVEAFLPLMMPGGVICGDDAHHPPVQQALEELFGLDNVEVGATVWIWRVPA